MMGSPTGDEAKLRSLLLLSSSSPEHVTEVCRCSEAVLQCLHSPAQARNFFTFFFPALLQKIFGFQQQEGALSSSLKASSPSPRAASSSSSSSSSSSTKGWLSAVSSSQNDAAAKALISLLSPSGTLLTSLLKLDKQSSSLRFLFPTERLPDWVQRSLKGVPSSSAHVPQLFTDRIKPNLSGASHVQLEIFEYFFFWFAYYAVCKTECGNITKEQASKENSVQKKSFPNWVAGLHHHRPSLPNWAVNHHHSSHQQNSSNNSYVGPYLQLLHLYIAHFVPVFTSSRASSPLARWEYDRLSTSAVVRSVSSHTDFLVQTFTEFWLVDEGSNDGAAYTPPSSQLTDAIRIFVNHMNKLSSSSSGWNTSFTYSQILQRALYRFFLRAFQAWATVSPVEKAFGVVDIWLDFLQPWVLERERDMDLSSETSAGIECGYSERWQNFVCGNYLFYTNLTVYFLEFALKYMHCNLEAMLQMTSKILNVLAGSSDLLEYVRKLNSLFNNNDAQSIQKSSGVVAAIWDQLHRLENVVDFDCNLRKDTSHVSPWNQLQLFSKNGNGGEAILELLILRAEGEMQLVSHTVLASCTKSLEAIKKAGGIIFNTTLSVMCPGVTSSPEVRQNTSLFQASRALPQHTWMDVKYKGDWMRRPIESTEIAWLVRLLVQLSEIINSRLDLYPNSEVPALDEGNDVADQACNHDTGNNLTMSTHNARDIFLDLNLTKVLDWILWGVWSTLSLLLNCVRGRGWRVNLRYLAKKPVALAVLLLIIYFFRRLSIQVMSRF